MSGSTVRRFLFEGLDIRGAIVRLDDCWQEMQANRNYPAPVAELLGGMAAVTALIAAQLKQPGRLTFQLRGEGPISILVMDCDEQLRLRGMARSVPDIVPAPAPVLLGAEQGGQLALTLDLPNARQPYQSIVPMVGASLAEIFEHYLEKSEQQASRLFLAADGERAVCLFLQKMPEADHKDADGWHRISQLADTVKKAELLDLDYEDLLRRLFHEDIADGGLRVYEPQPVTYHCPDARAKVADTLLSLGRHEVEAILAEHGEIHVRDDICNRDYRFTAEDVAALFAPTAEPGKLH